jgi:hypothetical protein
LGYAGLRHQLIVTQFMTVIGDRSSARMMESTSAPREAGFKPILLASTIVPNLKVVSATNSFQPLSLPLILVYTIITGRISPIALRFLYFFLMTSIVVTLIHGDLTGTTALYAGLYLSGPLTFIYMLGIGSERTRGLPAVLQVGLVICFVSVAEQFIIGSKAVENVWSMLFANHKVAAEFGIRGANGFTSEPSHVGRLFVMLLFIATITRIRGWRTWIVLGLPFVVMNRSASAFFLYVALLATLLFSRSKLFFTFALITAVLVFPYFADLDYRFVEEATRAWSALSSGDSAQSLVEVLGGAGGRRAIQTAVGFASLIYFPLGHGLASYLESFRDVAATMGFALSDFSTYDSLDAMDAQLKPSSYLSQIAYDFGLLGIVPLIALISGLRKQYGISRDPVARMCLIMGALQIILASTTTIPWPWVMMAAGLVPRSAVGDETAGPRAADV